MADNGKKKSFFEKFFWGDNLLNESKEPSFEILQREATPDELVLGWAENTDEQTLKTIRLTKGILQENRDAHFYVVGATRTGKTKFLESLIEQDIKNGLGFCVVDPHGDLTEDVKGYLHLLKGEKFLQENVVLIDPTDENSVVSFNPLEQTRGESAAAVAGELTEAFKKIWTDAWGQRMEDLLKNTLVALIENKLTLAELPLFLTNPEVRLKILANVKHDGCRQYFYGRFNAQRPQTQNEWSESTLNKVNGFLFDDKIKQIFLSQKSSFDLRDIMDNKKILLVKLDRGRLKGGADLLGSLLLAKIQASAFGRTDILESGRQMFYLYIDEFQNFATESFITMLAESAKYKLAVILAHQNLAQLPPSLRASILSNCGVQAYFRISRDDSNILAKESLAPIYQSPPGWESYIQLLQELQPRICFVKNKKDGGVVEIQTLNHEKAYKVAGRNEQEFVKEVAECEIGKKYLRDRKNIEKEYNERREKLLAKNGPDSFREEKNRVNYEEIIKKGENDEVEFKPSLRRSYEQGGKEKTMEYAVAKAISAFMNAEGGVLFVGVKDTGEILGLENDYSTVRHQNKDGFKLQLTQVINQYFGKEFHQFMNIKVISVRGKDICVIDVLKSEMPVYLKNGDKLEFYVRASATSQSLNIREANEYIKTHFKTRDLTF